MRELRDILSQLASLRGRGEPAAVATVVRVRGSTYRREGARLLIEASGRTVGSISGGCLEGDVAEIARDVLETGRPRLVNYDMTSDDDAVWGLGLGCNGAIDVFVEAVTDARGDEMVALLRDSVEHRRTIALATVIAAPQGGVEVGARLIVPADPGDGRARGTLGDPALDARVRAAVRDQLAVRRSEVLTLEAPGGRRRGVRRDRVPAAAAVGLRGRPRHAAGRPARARARMVGHGRGQPAGVRQPGAVSRRGRGGARRRRGCAAQGAHRPRHLRDLDDPQLPARSQPACGASSVPRPAISACWGRAGGPSVCSPISRRKA